MRTPPSSRRANRLVAALDDFGFGSVGLTATDFLEEDMVVQLGYPPKRIDIITQADGVEFGPCWDRRIEVETTIAGRLHGTVASASKYE